jgi:hypothetical protein
MDDNQVIVSIDNFGFTVEFKNQLRNLISYYLNTCQSHVMVCFTHTHSAPKTIGMEEIIIHYCKMVEEQVLVAVTMAEKDLKAARLGWDISECKIGVNRRVHKNDQAIMGENADGPVDNRLAILKAENAETNELMGVLLRMSAHANVLKGENLKNSADYPGRVCVSLEETYNCPVLFTVGAAGNINPIWRGGEDELNYTSSIIIRHVENRLGIISTVKEVDVNMISYMLPVKTNTDRVRKFS